MNPAFSLARNNAWIFTCERWAQENTYIILPVNPTDFDVTLPIRKTVETYRSTKIAYVWRTPGTKSIFGPITLQIQISSGNALPVFRDEYIQGCAMASKALGISEDRAAIEGMRKYIDENYMADFPGRENHAAMNVGSYAGLGSAHRDSKPWNRPDLYFSDVPIGIQNIYALHALVDDRRIMPERYSDTGAPQGHRDNRAVLTVNTLAFPRLMIWGWFGQDGMSITESVDTFGEVNCSFSFHVTDTNPRLTFNQWQELISSYRTNIVSQESTLDWTRSVMGLHKQASNYNVVTPKPPVRDSSLSVNTFGDQLA